MIEKIKIKNKRGIGPIVLFGWLPFFNLVCTFYAFMFLSRSGGLRYDPKCWITDRLNLGSGICWGIFYLLSGILLSVCLTPVIIQNGDILWAFVIVYPLLPIGLALLLSSVRHKHYLTDIENLLQTISGRQRISKTNFRLPAYGRNKTADFNAIKYWLEDLRQNGILKYWDEPGTDNLFIELTAPELTGRKSGASETPEAEEGKFVKWTCSCCGAENQTITGLLSKTTCDYCGASPETEPES